MSFSIIIPHKNTPELLQRCLDSIPRRKDVQIIVVDDNSDADKVDFNNFPGLGDPKVEVYLTKEGKGAGYARNVGMSRAKGDWLIFADADDYFYTENLSILMDMQIPDEYNVIVWKSKYVYLDGTSRWLNEDIECADGIVSCTSVEKLYGEYVTPWAKMVRRSFCQGINLSFEEVRFSNDEIFSTRLGLSVFKYGYVALSIYCHERVKGSLVESGGVDNWKSRLSVYFRKNKLLVMNNRQIIDLQGIFGFLYEMDYHAFLSSFGEEKKVLGWRVAYKDYKSFCYKKEISLLPFFKKICFRRFCASIKYRLRKYCCGKRV